MEIYKLNYLDKETAIADLLAKGVYNEDLSYGQGIQAVVEIGKVVKIEGNVITEPIYYDGYAYDVMCIQEIVFESEIFPVDCVHSFAGYAKNADGYIPNDLIIGLKVENRKK